MNKLAELLEFISSQHVINDKDKLQADDVSVLPTWYALKSDVHLLDSIPPCL